MAVNAAPLMPHEAERPSLAARLDALAALPARMGPSAVSEDAFKSYRKVMDLADEKNWWVELRCDTKSKESGAPWELCIYEGDELIVKCRSGMKPAACFQVMGTKALASLRKAGRIK